MSYYDAQLTPEPDHHGESPYPLGGDVDVLPYGDVHGASPYPINSSGDVTPKADTHENQGFNLHKGTPKPGSFKS